jgi:hypothetical protein
MARGETLRKLFRSFSRNEREEFLAAAMELIEEEKNKNHILLARDLEKLLQNGNGYTHWCQLKLKSLINKVKDKTDGADGKSRKKGATRIPVRIIEYTIEENGTPKTYRLITNLMDIAKFPALMLAQEYHQRWEAENTLDELKIHLNGRKTQIRSKNPREVVQEIYGWLLAHYCLRCLMFQSATLKNISPLRLSFVGSLRVIRRAIPEFQRQINNQLDINTYYSWLIAEISDLEIPLRQHRSNPRVVKKARSKFKSKKRSHRNHATPRQQLSFQIVKQAS